MKFITVRDLATKNKKTREVISREETVLTYNGKPIGLILPTSEDDFEFMLRETTAIMARKAVANMRKTAAKGLTNNEVEKEIKAARRALKK
jgi:hypothetical protein